MHSILITGGNLEKRKKKASHVTCYMLHVTRIDTLIIVGANSIGIDEIRRLEQWASRKPHSSKFKTAIIYEAEKLTHQAQNALLKTLEEPPKDTFIILAAPQESFLLPTIVSRCKIIKLKPESEMKLDEQTLKSVLHVTCYMLHARVGERIKKAQEIAKTREETTVFLDRLICLLREILLKKYKISRMQAIASFGDISEFKDLSGKEVAGILRNALKTKKIVEKNVNFRLALENFFLDLPLLK